MNPFEQLRALLAGSAQVPMAQAGGQPTQAGSPPPNTQQTGAPPQSANPLRDREAMLDRLAQLGPPPDVPFGSPVRNQEASNRPQQTPGNMQTAAGGNDQARANPQSTSEPNTIGAALGAQSQVKRKAQPILPGQAQSPQVGGGLGAALGAQ